MAQFEGILASTITPRGRNGDVDFSAAFDLIDYLCAAKVNGIALFAAQGEYPAATCDERARLVYLAVKRSRIPVYVGVGAVTLEASVELARGARDAGAAGLLLPPPLFYIYRQDEIREFYSEFALQAGAGAYLYNISEHVSAIAEETAAALLKKGKFAGIVDASGDIGRLERLRAAAPEGVQILGASDTHFSAVRAAGAPGILSDAACAIPELMVSLDRAITAGDESRRTRLEALLGEFLNWTERFPKPALVKTAVKQRGVKTGPLPAPLPSEKRKKLDEFRGWFENWLASTREMRADA